MFKTRNNKMTKWQLHLANMEIALWTVDLNITDSTDMQIRHCFFTVVPNICYFTISCFKHAYLGDVRNVVSW